MNLIRQSFFVAKGLQEFTKSGFEKAAKGFVAADLENVKAHGRNYMVTGSNTGIGKVVATELAKAGGTVHLVCRNPERGEAALNEIKEESKNNSVFLHVVDLAKPREVYKFACDFAAKGEGLDVLVNNAGCIIPKRTIDDLGFETNFATNTLAVHLLTKTFMPLLEESKDARVVTVSSAGMLTQKLDADDAQSEKANFFTSAYTPPAQQKRQQVVMSEMYASRHPLVHFSTMHPGWADTTGVKEAMPAFYRAMKSTLRSPVQGADTVVWLALSPAAKLVKSGQFFQDRQPVATHLPLCCTQESESDRKRFMKVLDEMLDQVKNSLA
ncbi:dehydrogenase/reductase SDR family member 12-like [Watersipora subatra]|uniref:dehydrogenase/reductase SDR family member 12-like n=1 Tax=Watersipora subatra TaxID=2589382 RepID=UPI00355C62D0